MTHLPAGVPAGQGTPPRGVNFLGHLVRHARPLHTWALQPSVNSALQLQATGMRSSLGNDSSAVDSHGCSKSSVCTIDGASDNCSDR